jgi:hypothetical protein
MNEFAERLVIVADKRKPYRNSMFGNAKNAHLIRILPVMTDIHDQPLKIKAKYLIGCLKQEPEKPSIRTTEGLIKIPPEYSMPVKQRYYDYI